MPEENDQYAYLRLVEFDENPDDITSRLGIQPTECWRKGEAISDSSHVRKFNCWKLESRLSRTADFEDHIADVLRQLDVNKDGVKQIVKEHGWGCMQLVGYFNSHYPGLCLDAELVQRIAEYGLSVDCDFYYQYDEDDDE
jgi:hypothetical protein